MKNTDDNYLTAHELAQLIGATVNLYRSGGQTTLSDVKLRKRRKLLEKRSHNLTRTARWNDMEGNEESLFKVGELAKLVGVTVRTLQYYDQANLLNSTYTEGHKRVYTRDDLLKLQQILFLKSLGFPLQEIKNKILKSENSADLETVFTQQREILLEQIANLNKIVDTLDSAIAETKSEKEISVERLITIMELMKQGNPYSFVVRYFDDEQLKSVADQLFNSSEENRSSVKEVFSQLDSLYRQGADPAGEEGQALAERWWNIVNAFTAGDLDMMERLFSAGRDISNWPKDTKNIQEPIENFLGKALWIYLKNHGIELKNMAKK